MQRVEVEQRSQLGHDAATNDVSAGALPRGWLAARRKAHSRVAAQDSREGVQIGIGSLLVDSVVVDWAGGRLLIGGLVERCCPEPQAVLVSGNCLFLSLFLGTFEVVFSNSTSLSPTGSYLAVD